MKIFHGRYRLQFNITIPKINHIENIDYLKYNDQSLNSIYEEICVGNGRLFYFDEDGKLDIYYILNEDSLLLKNHQLFSLNALK